MNIAKSFTSWKAYALRYVCTAVATVANNATILLTFDLVTRDNSNGDWSTANNMWTCSKAGWYSYNVSVGFTTSLTRHILTAYLNCTTPGDSTTGTQIGGHDKNPIGVCAATLSGCYYFAVGDTLQFYIYQTSGGAATKDVPEANVMSINYEGS